MNKLFAGSLAALILLLCVLLAVWMAVRPRHDLAKAPPPPDPGLVTPKHHEETPLPPVERVTARSTPTPTPMPPTEPVAEKWTQSPFKTRGPGWAYASSAATPTKTSETDPAPAEDRPAALYGRLIPCKTVNGITSSSRDRTPIIGMVDESLVWNHRLVVGRCSEVHGTAQLNFSKDRISSEDVWTIVLHDENRPEWSDEMVVKAMVLDREDDPNLKSYAILNASPGLRGERITNDSMAEAKLFAATAFGAAAQGTQATTAGLFGVQSNPSGRGAGGVSGAILNPIAQGVGAAMEDYAQLILDDIKRDGVFILVPAGKRFYLYVLQDIHAPKGSDEERNRARKDFLKERDLEEQVTSPRDAREEQAREAARNPYAGVTGSPPSDASIDQAKQRQVAARLRMEQQANAMKTNAAQP